MKLYEIDSRIEELFAMLEPDPETGEVVADFEDVCGMIAALEGEKQDKLANIAKAYRNSKAAAEAYKAEKLRLANNQAIEENRAKRYLATLDFFAKGEKMDLGIAKLSYRASKSLQVDDANAAAAWLEAHGYFDYVTHAAPTISKNDVKKLMTAGTEVPGCEVVETVSCIVK